MQAWAIAHSAQAAHGARFSQGADELETLGGADTFCFQGSWKDGHPQVLMLTTDITPDTVLSSISPLQLNNLLVNTVPEINCHKVRDAWGGEYGEMGLGVRLTSQGGACVTSFRTNPSMKCSTCCGSSRPVKGRAGAGGGMWAAHRAVPEVSPSWSYMLP